MEAVISTLFETKSPIIIFFGLNFLFFYLIYKLNKGEDTKTTNAINTFRKTMEGSREGLQEDIKGLSEDVRRYGEISHEIRAELQRTAYKTEILEEKVKGLEEKHDKLKEDFLRHENPNIRR